MCKNEKVMIPFMQIIKENISRVIDCNETECINKQHSVAQQIYKDWKRNCVF